MPIVIDEMDVLVDPPAQPTNGQSSETAPRHEPDPGKIPAIVIQAWMRRLEQRMKRLLAD